MPHPVQRLVINQTRNMPSISAILYTVFVFIYIIYIHTLKVFDYILTRSFVMPNLMFVLRVLDQIY